MASFDPPPRIMGGYAEDALIAWSVTRPHPGQPFYLSAKGDLSIDIGVLDGVNGAPFFDVHSVVFQIDGHDPPVGYRVHLPANAYEQPQASIDGCTCGPCRRQLRTRCASRSPRRGRSDSSTRNSDHRFADSSRRSSRTAPTTISHPGWNRSTGCDDPTNAPRGAASRRREWWD